MTYQSNLNRREVLRIQVDAMTGMGSGLCMIGVGLVYISYLLLEESRDLRAIPIGVATVVAGALLFNWALRRFVTLAEGSRANSVTVSTSRRPLALKIFWLKYRFFRGLKCERAV